jgi:hydroxymethylglutaryl-CoA reductase (NADPH)
MNMKKIPYLKEGDFTHEMATKRREFVKEVTGAELKHVGSYSFDPSVLPGNIESFIGVAQVPIGLAGPLLVHGEHAQGEFYVPLATSEGTLVASYSRGMKLLTEAGGVTCTVIEEKMQRAPLFVFKNARYAREFGKWLEENFKEIKAKAEETTKSGKLVEVEQYGVGKMRFLRFNYTTGDAAGQNMVSRATHHACKWILQQKPEGLEHFTLAAQMDTDKKHSQINTLKTRGKRVVAEAVIPNELLKRVMHTTSRALFNQRQYSNVGALLGHSANNGSHSANGLTAMFIATGQDAANIAESSAAIVHCELKDNDDFYISITIPSLIIATYGGGTGLPTQQECLKMLGCDGKGKVYKLAEIMAGVVLAGEMSLGSAIVADEWVSSHEAHGRNR